MNLRTELDATAKAHDWTPVHVGSLTTFTKRIEGDVQVVMAEFSTPDTIAEVRVNGMRKGAPSPDLAADILSCLTYA